MHQELSLPSRELWRVEDLFASAEMFGFNGSVPSSGAIPGFMVGAAAASLYSMEMTSSEGVPLDRALLASQNHREAERRRRERIKSHLDRLRLLLACDPKIDKASLLAKAVEHVRDLKQRAADIPEIDHFPTETDEISVCHTGPLIRASVCCEDRNGLLQELIQTLKSLRLRTLRAEMATLGGRVRSVFVVTREGDEEEEEVGDVVEGIGGSTDFIRDALKTLVERPTVLGEGRPKRRRMVDLAATV